MRNWFCRSNDKSIRCCPRLQGVLTLAVIAVLWCAVPHAWADPGIHAETCAEAQTAARAVMKLRPEQRQVLELGLLQGMSHSEIAEALKMPLGTVKTMMRRGLIQGRELMGVDANVSDEMRP